MQQYYIKFKQIQKFSKKYSKKEKTQKSFEELFKGLLLNYWVNFVFFRN